MSNSIGKYIQLQGGFAFKSSDFRESGIPLIRISNVTENGLNKSDAVFLPEEFIDELKDFLLKENDTLIAMSGATTGKCCLIKSTDIPGFINQRVGRFRILNEKETDKLFVYHVVNSSRFKDELLKDAFGSAQPNVSPRDIENVKWYFPSFTEQQHIAKILSTADAVIEKTQAAIAKYKAIKQGMLQDLFTRGIDLNTNKLRPRYEDAPELYKDSKLGMIPREWEEKIVDDIAKVNGRVGWKGYTVADLRDFGPLALGATHIDKENKLDLSNPIHLSMEKYIESPEIIVQFGDLLIVQRGTIGKIVVIDRQIGEATINPSMVLLNNIKINNFFLYYQLCSFIGQLQIELLTTQTGVPMISQEQIKNINLIIPKNPKETDAIAERLKNIDTILDNEKSYLQKMQSLKKGLMEDLLSGKKQVKVAEEVLTQSEN